METRKLYYEDCHLAEFEAVVLSCEEVKGGYAVALDATAFYPEGGGQACDLGQIADVSVLDVQEQGEQVIHLCAAPLIPGQQVRCRIDYDRRFDLMQQHTGEHIISGLIHSRYGYHNTGFHMGSDVITIDFDGVIPAEDLPLIEAAANEALWKNLPVKCWYPSPEELPHTVYRTKRALNWPVRIVEVPGYDRCACCGVHTAFTGEVGIVKLFSVIGFRGGSRMEMACGKRAFSMLNAAYEQNKQVSQAFSAKITETGAAARRMNEVLEQQKYHIHQLLQKQFESIAQSYVNCGDVLHFAKDLDSVQVRQLADAIAEGCGGMAAVFSGSETEGYAYCLVIRQGDLRSFGKAMTSALHGRGGGKPNFQQGRVMAAKAEIKGFFKNTNV